MDILKIDPKEKANQVTAEKRKQIVNLLKAFRLEIIKPLAIEEVRRILLQHLAEHSVAETKPSS